MIPSYHIIKIILADDHQLIRDGFQVMLKKQSDMEIIGEASNGEELLQLAFKLNPDVVITDIKMPKVDGIEATKKLKAELPHVGVIALSMFDDEDLIIEMLEAGAKGYLLKNAHKEEIIACIQSVYHDRVYYCNHTSAKLVHLIARSNYNPYNQIKRPVFNDREISIIKLICQEYATREIAGQLHLSVRTIEGYRESILEKMQVKNTAGIVVYAIKNNLFKL